MDYNIAIYLVSIMLASYKKCFLLDYQRNAGFTEKILRMPLKLLFCWKKFHHSLPHHGDHTHSLWADGNRDNNSWAHNSVIIKLNYNSHFKALNSLLLYTKVLCKTTSLLINSASVNMATSVNIPTPYLKIYPTHLFCSLSLTTQTVHINLKDVFVDVNIMRCYRDDV